MRQTVMTLLMLAVPRLALACPVCFGQNDSPLGIAMNNGIMLMLGVVVAVLACFASFFIYLMRRAKLAERISRTNEVGQYLEGQEGTAQC
jgi:uncharacterized protein (DUF58 family)